MEVKNQLYREIAEYGEPVFQEPLRGHVWHDGANLADAEEHYHSDNDDAGKYAEDDAHLLAILCKCSVEVPSNHSKKKIICYAIVLMAATLNNSPVK